MLQVSLRFNITTARMYKYSMILFFFACRSRRHLTKNRHFLQ